MEQRQLLEEALYPQIRVRANKSGGSGTIIYSGPRQDNPERYSTWAITCHHVIKDLIKLKREWDSRLGRERKRELRSKAGVEFFDYGYGERVDRTYGVDADIMAYDADHDMALLKLRTTRPADYVAKLYPRNEHESIIIGDQVYAVGCALLHDPIMTDGMVTHKGDEIDHKEYWMSNSQIIFGNSGGAMFRWSPEREQHEFIGIPSRIDIAGWASPVTHLGYFSPINRVYEFMEDQLMTFLFGEKTEEECLEDIRKRKDAEEERLRLLSS